MTYIVISIGSNFGNRIASLQYAVNELGNSVCNLSPVFETTPWGESKQELFLNAIVIANNPNLNSYDWLKEGKRIERESGRKKNKRWGLRTLDVDLIVSYNINRKMLCCDTKNLVLPHLLTHMRAFVLIPWLAINSNIHLKIMDHMYSTYSLVKGINTTEKNNIKQTNLVLNYPES